MLLLTLSHCYADPTTLAKSRKDEEGDLVTAVKQKLLKRILSQVTPKREPVTTPRRAPKREPVTPPPTLPIKIPKKQPATRSRSCSKENFEKDEKDTAIPQTVETSQRVDKLGSVRKKEEEKIREFYLGFRCETLRFYCKTISI